MKRVTRNVDAAALLDLLEQPPRANLAFNDSGTIAAMPVAFRFAAGRYWIGIPRGAADPIPQLGAPVTLLIDDGWYWTELRAIKVRGSIAAAEGPPPSVAPELNWLQVVPEKIVAWDYGALREEEEPDASG